MIRQRTYRTSKIYTHYLSIIIRGQYHNSNIFTRQQVRQDLFDGPKCWWAQNQTPLRLMLFHSARILSRPAMNNARKKLARTFSRPIPNLAFKLLPKKLRRSTLDS